jgi:hypothetical protein
MDRFNLVAYMVLVRLAGLADWLYGCSHRRTTFPITLRASVSVDGQQSTQAETYVVCVECGRHFGYDWTTMRITRQRAAWARSWSGLGKISDKNDVSCGERLSPEPVSLGFHQE